MNTFSAARFLERPPYEWESPDVMKARAQAALQLDGSGLGATTISVVRLRGQWPLRWAASMWKLKACGAGNPHVGLEEVAFGMTRAGVLWTLRHRVNP